MSIIAVLSPIIVSFVQYDHLCVLQDSLSEWRIRLARWPDGNASNIAACLPPEVQLQIFHLLRMRGRFGSREHLARDANGRFVQFSGARNLAAASRVCLAWRTAAIEALYRDAVLLTAWRTYLFSYTLRARPALAQLVRRIELPQWERYPLTSAKKRHRATREQFFAAIEHIVSHCVHATDIRLFRDKTPLLDQIPGFRAAAPHHVSHLAIHSDLPNRLNVSTAAHEPEEVDLLVLLGFLPCLNSLTLTGHRMTFNTAALRNSQRSALGSICALYLGACSLDMHQLVLLLKRLPRLRTAELRDLDFSDSHAAVSVTDLFATQRNTLIELCLRVDANTPAAKRRITFSTFVAFSALRTLLPTINELPPNLHELIVSFAPYSCVCRRDKWKKHLFNTVDNVSQLAETAPALRAVQLWDVVHVAQLAHWSVVAFVLREMLAGAGIAVDVNLLCIIMRLRSVLGAHDLGLQH